MSGALGHDAGPGPFASLLFGFRFMTSRILIAVLCAGALAFVRAPHSRSAAASTASLATTAAASHTAAARAAAAQAKLATTFEVKVADDGVSFALRVTNEGKKHVEVTFPNGQTHDFVVVDSVGREIWRWGASRLFTQNVQNKLLGGGESMRIIERWDHPGQHGKYTAIATLHSTNYPIEERVAFVLP